MFKFIKELDAKTLTTAGAVVIALALVYVIWNISGEGIKAIADRVDARQNDYETLIQANNEVLREMVKVIEGNTKALESVQRELSGRRYYSPQ